MSSADGTMPERYRPDPWLDREAFPDNYRGGANVTVPRTAFRWIDAQAGERLKVAPRSPTAVTVGRTCPGMIGDFALSPEAKEQAINAKVPKFALRYMGVEPGDTVRFEQVDDHTFRIINMDDTDVDACNCVACRRKRGEFSGTISQDADAEMVTLASSVSTGSSVYHTRECEAVKSMKSPRKASMDFAEWKEHTECKRCQRIRGAGE